MLPYERQLEVKDEQVDDALRRIGRLDGFELEPIVPAVQQWRYRNKLEYSFGAGPDGGLICGFHAPGRWHEIVEVDDCLLASEAGNARARAVVDWCRAAGPARRTTAAPARACCATSSSARAVARGQLQVRLVTGPGELDRDGARRGRRRRDGRPLDADRQRRRDDAGRRDRAARRRRPARGGARRPALRISPEAFFQTNTEMAEQLYALAIEYAGLRGFERVYDLYCGIGTIGLLLAPRAAEVWGLELVEQAVADAIANARRNEIDNARFFAGDVRLALRELVEQAGRPDVLVVDPPRAGLSQKIVRRIIEAAPQRIVYVSCNPTTLAPNAAQLVEAGYALKRVRPVDMFPQTPHIECVALLERVR